MGDADFEVTKQAALTQQERGEGALDHHNEFRAHFDATMKAHSKKLGASENKAIYKAVRWRDESAPPAIAKPSKLKARGHFAPGYDGAYLETVGKGRFMVEYELDTDLRDTEQVLLKDPGVSRCSLEAKCCPTRRMPGSQ